MTVVGVLQKGYKAERSTVRPHIRKWERSQIRIRTAVESLWVSRCKSPPFVSLRMF